MKTFFAVVVSFFLAQSALALPLETVVLVRTPDRPTVVAYIEFDTPPYGGFPVQPMTEAIADQFLALPGGRYDCVLKHLNGQVFELQSCTPRR